jgi:hypothetical protein
MTTHAEIQKMLQTRDSFAAIEHIQRQGSPQEIARLYESLVLDLYWKAHDLPAVIVIARAGITYCLGQAPRQAASPESAAKLRGIAKAIAYNVGSFTWPGWEEPGINPSAADLAFGRDCANLNLQLANELNKPPAALSSAHWLVGAHALASGDFSQAAKEFQTAHDLFPPDDPSARAAEPRNLGFRAVADICANPSNSAAIARFNEITATLLTQTDDDSREYHAQLTRARRVFANR